MEAPRVVDGLDVSARLTNALRVHLDPSRGSTRLHKADERLSRDFRRTELLGTAIAFERAHSNPPVFPMPNLIIEVLATRVASVPDLGATSVLFGLGLLGVGAVAHFLRKKKK